MSNHIHAAMKHRLGVGFKVSVSARRSLCKSESELHGVKKSTSVMLCKMQTHTYHTIAMRFRDLLFFANKDKNWHEHVKNIDKQTHKAQCKNAVAKR